MRALFLNDIGFYGGAGIAQRRQAAAFLQAGHEAMGLAGIQIRPVPELDRLSQCHGSRWHGVEYISDLYAYESLSPGEIRTRLLRRAREWQPDVVVAGNFHYTHWPIEVLTDLHDAGLRVVAYAHDVFWATGGCACLKDCAAYLDGCQAPCPYPRDYPQRMFTPGRDVWQARHRVFVGAGIPLATNSRWSAKIFNDSFGGRAQVHHLPLGLDTELFSPLDKSLARRLLGLDDQGFYVLFGSVGAQDVMKGGRQLPEFARRVAAMPGTRLLAFGNDSYMPGNIHSLGFADDEALMPVFYGAADMYVTLSHAETFGQTALEATACGLPVVAYVVGGLPEIARHEVNALTAPLGDLEALCHAVEHLRHDPKLLQALATAGRGIALEEFSLERQYRHWAGFLAMQWGLA